MRDPRVRAIVGGAALHFLLLVFVLAIDPKPRMFLLEAAGAAALLGAALARAPRDPLLLSAAAFILLAGVVGAVTRPLIDPPAAAVAAWLDEPAGTLAATSSARQLLTYQPGVDSLSVPDDPAARTLLATAPGSCRPDHHAGWRLDGALSFRRQTWPIVDAVRGESARNREGLVLCRYRRLG